MPPFSGKQKKEQLKARRQRKREESARAREREKVREDAILAGADPDVLAEAEAAAAAALPHGRHAQRRQRRQNTANAHSDGREEDGQDGGSDYDRAVEYKYGADRRGVRSVFQKESRAELDARRALNYQPLARRTVITSSGVPYGSWFVLAGDEAVMTAAKKKKAQKELEMAARAAAKATDSDSKEIGEGEGAADQPAPAATTTPPLVVQFGSSAVSATFPFSVELPSRGWSLDAETGQLTSTYTTQGQADPHPGGVHDEDDDDVNSDGDEEPSGRSSHASGDSGAADASESSESISATAEHCVAGAVDHTAVDQAEKRCFRRYLSVLENYPLPQALEGLQLNAYERNLDVWRQLWRTVEVSDVVVAVTDARYPIIHAPIALLRYITVDRRTPCVVVLNKSDLVPANVLQGWVQFLTQFFERVGLRVESVDAVTTRGKVGPSTEATPAPIVLIPFTTDPRGGQAAIEGITERIDVSKRRRKKEKRRANMYEQLRTGRVQFDADSSGDDDETTYHSDVNFKGMKQAEHDLQQDRRAYSELKVVADAITSMLALCRSLVSKEKRSMAEAAATAASAERQSSPAAGAHMRTGHLPTSSRVKAKTGRKQKSKRRALLPHGGVAPPSASDDESETGRASDGDGAEGDDEVLHDREADQEAYVHVGFVGFPNVGKSSLLNCIRGTKVVSVSATPGHTKHLQTIPIPSEGITLVDSPGLAFPLFGVPQPLQAIVGTHQIAQTRDPQSGVAYLASYLPIEKMYGLSKPDGASEEEEWTPYDICEAYAKKRGFFVKHGKGTLDVHRGAIALLQEAYEGRLAFFFAPPELNLLDAKYIGTAVLPYLYLPVLHDK